MPTWRDVTDYIGKDVLRIIHEADSKQMLTGYQLLLSGNKALSGAFVHLVDSRVLENVGIQSGNALIVKLSSEEDIENINIPESNLAVFCGDSQEAYVVQRMNELFSVHQNVEVLLSKMQRIVSGNKGLNALLSEVADFFRMPVDILDNSFRFIAVSDNKWLQSPMREEYAAKERYIPAFVLDELQSSGQLKQIIESVTAVRIDGENYKAWAYPLITNRVKIGYMMFFEPPNLRKNEGLIREYLTYLPFISSFICMELGKQTFFNLNKGDYYNFILSTLLNGKEKDFESVRQRLRISNYKLEKNLYLICVEPKAEGQSSRWMQTVAVHLRDLFANSFYINRGGKLFYMVSRASDYLVSENEEKIWESYLRTSRLCAGITGPFFDFMDMETRRKEAEMALDTAKSQGISFVRFQAAQMDALKVMLQSQKLTQSFCMESVGKLIEYDNKYETELVKTLKAYLLSPKDVAGICSRLNIHRNTFYKRLDKMKDILGNELSSAEDFMKIQLTLHLMNIE